MVGMTIDLSVASGPWQVAAGGVACGVVRGSHLSNVPSPRSKVLSDAVKCLWGSMNSVPFESNGCRSGVLMMQEVESPRGPKQSGLDFAENPLWSGFVRFAG